MQMSYLTNQFMLGCILQPLECFSGDLRQDTIIFFSAVLNKIIPPQQPALVLNNMVAAYLLRFRLYSDAPPEIRELYKQAYDDILSNDSERFDRYLHKWIDKLKEDEIGTDIDWQCLNRAEGGIGGNDNRKNRQIRLFNSIEHKTSFRKFGEITLRAEPSDDEMCKWSVEELVQFGDKFKEVLESSVVSNCMDFYIAVDCM